MYVNILHWSSCEINKQCWGIEYMLLHIRSAGYMLCVCVCVEWNGMEYALRGSTKASNNNSDIIKDANQFDVALGFG
jgi:hypothetical protein